MAKMRTEPFSWRKYSDWIVKACSIVYAIMWMCPWCVAQETYDTASINDSSVLRTDIIDANDHRFRPIINQSSVILVNVEFHLYHILHLDEIEMKMKTSCAFHFSWKDEIRVWSPRGYTGILVIHPDPTDVWRPRLFVTNSLTALDVFKDDYAHLSVLWNGRTRWRPGVILVTTCDLDLTSYPYDEHVCSIFVRTSLFSREMEFNITRKSALIDQYTKNGEWILLNTEIETYEIGDEGERFSELVIRLYLRRHPGFFFLNSLFPTMLLSFLSIMVFVLPRSSGERAGYSMTVLLSLSLVQTTVSSGLPTTPQTFPYLVMYIFILMLLSWAMMICTIAILAWKNLQENDASNNDLGDSCDLRSLAQLEENFVAVNPSPFDDDNTDKENLKGYYGPLGEDNDASQSGVTRRKFVFLRDFRRVHPERSAFERQAKEESSESKDSRLRWFGLKQSSIHCLVVHDIDLVLFWIFLFMWLVVSLVFYFLMVFG